MAGDLVKTLAQFQTFTIKQTEFLAEMVKDKNFVGLLRYAVAGYAFVNTVGQAIGMEEKELAPMLRFDVPPSLKFPTEVAKAALNTPDKYGNVPSTEKKLSNIGKSFMGLVPGGSQMKKTYEGIKSVQEGGSYDAAGRKQFEQGTSTPAKIQSVLFGKYASPQAKDYFNKEVNTGDKELDTAIKADKEATATMTEQANVLANELKKLPKEEAKARLLELAKTDEALANKVLDKIEEAALGLTEKDKAILSLGVTNGARAEYIVSQLNKLETNEEKKAYLLELTKKKILTDKVLDQVLVKLEQ
jgi:hypothetical protein